MIKAEHKKWARILYDIYITRLLKKNFNRFLLTNDFPMIDPGSALIITPNHFSWWDGFFIDYFTRKFLKRNIFLLMLEEQLKHFWFFKKVGAYSINPESPKSIAETFNYTIEVLDSHENFVVYYPQGKIEAYDKRPPELKPGIMSIVKQVQVRTEIITVVFKIVYADKKTPDVLVRTGKKLLCSSELKFEEIKSSFENTLNELDEYSITGTERDLFLK